VSDKEQHPYFAEQTYEKHRLIETKLPLWWILASVASIVFSLGGVFVQLDGVIENISKLERKIDLQEARFLILTENVSANIATNKVQQSQIDRAAADLNELSKYNRPTRQ